MKYLTQGEGDRGGGGAEGLPRAEGGGGDHRGQPQRTAGIICAKKKIPKSGFIVVFGENNVSDLQLDIEDTTI